MDAHELLERLPAIAESIERTHPVTPGTAGDWTVHAHEPGQEAGRTVRLRSYGQCRTLALDLVQHGFVVVVRDPNQSPRLQLWPASPY